MKNMPEDPAEQRWLKLVELFSKAGWSIVEQGTVLLSPERTLHLLCESFATLEFTRRVISNLQSRAVNSRAHLDAGVELTDGELIVAEAQEAALIIASVIAESRNG